MGKTIDVDGGTPEGWPPKQGGGQKFRHVGGSGPRPPILVTVAVALFGIVVNAAIIYIDFADRLIRKNDRARIAFDPDIDVLERNRMGVRRPETPRARVARTCLDNQQLLRVATRLMNQLHRRPRMKRERESAVLVGRRSSRRNNSCSKLLSDLLEASEIGGHE